MTENTRPDFMLWTFNVSGDKILECTELHLLLCKECSECSAINLFLMLWLQQNKLNFYLVKTDPKAVMGKQHGLCN